MSIRFYYLLGVAWLFISACGKPQVLDINQSVKDTSWLYNQSVKAEFEVTDSLKAYQLLFKFRNTQDYPYENLYVIMRLKGPGLNKQLRYKFQIADSKGAWLGKGSGDRFQLLLPLYPEFKFPKKGKYSLEIEHNMDTNPLSGVSDIGLNIN
ncbi:MAG: gliding motility lipoprotein GldH [Pedobacter sp.]|nr:MAG: gliding motility lipoprotein GldH [Pedobacter sp.]